MSSDKRSFFELENRVFRRLLLILSDCMTIRFEFRLSIMAIVLFMAISCADIKVIDVVGEYRVSSFRKTCDDIEEISLRYGIAEYDGKLIGFESSTVFSADGSGSVFYSASAFIEELDSREGTINFTYEIDDANVLTICSELVDRCMSTSQFQTGGLILSFDLAYDEACHLSLYNRREQ